MSDVSQFEVGAEVYNHAVNDAMATHLFPKQGVNGGDVAAMDDEEFLGALQSGDKQPLNPVRIAREALELPEDTPVAEVMDGLAAAHGELLQTYEDNGVDPEPALQAAGDIIAHTEAYIAGYSRALGSFANAIHWANPSHDGPKRWIDHVWVPEEDMHDRSLAFMMAARANPRLEEFYDHHAHHMQVGMHVPLEDPLQATAYLAQQEGSTGPSYKGYEALLGPVLGAFPRAIGNQEARHTRFYRYVARELAREYPDDMTVALLGEEQNFAMPGQQGIPDFKEKAGVAGGVGILDPEKIITVQRGLNAYMGLDGLDYETDEGKAARDALIDPFGDFGERMLEKRASQMAKARERAARRAEGRGEFLPAIIDVTVVQDPRTGELSFPRS